jgi:hypothetical protein
MTDDERLAAQLDEFERACAAQLAADVRALRAAGAGKTTINEHIAMIGNFVAVTRGAIIDIANAIDHFAQRMQERNEGR